MTFIIGRQPRATASENPVKWSSVYVFIPYTINRVLIMQKVLFFKIMQEFNYVARNMRTQSHTSHAESQEDTDSLSAHLSEVCPLGRLT